MRAAALLGLVAGAAAFETGVVTLPAADGVGGVVEFAFAEPLSQVRADACPSAVEMAMARGGNGSTVVFGEGAFVGAFEQPGLRGFGCRSEALVLSAVGDEALRGETPFRQIFEESRGVTAISNRQGGLAVFCGEGVGKAAAEEVDELEGKIVAGDKADKEDDEEEVEEDEEEVAAVPRKPATKKVAIRAARQVVSAPRAQYTTVILSYTGEVQRGVVSDVFEKDRLYLHLACSNEVEKLGCLCAYRATQDVVNKPGLLKAAEKEAPAGAPANVTDAGGIVADPVGGGGMSAGAKAGAAVAGLGALGLLGLLAFCFFRGAGGSARRRKGDGSEDEVVSSADPDGVELGERRFTEMAAPQGRAPAPVEIRGGPAVGAGVGAGGAAVGRMLGGEGKEEPYKTTVREPNRVIYGPATVPISDAVTMRDGLLAAGAPIAEDGTLPIHLAIALDTSNLGCSASHDHGDNRRAYATALSQILESMGDRSLVSLVIFSGDDAAIAPTGARVTRRDDVVATVAACAPPRGATRERAAPKAAMRAVNMCVGLLREGGEAGIAKRALLLTGGGASGAEMRAVRAEANQGRGWDTANCMVVAAVGDLADPTAVVQLGAVAVEVDSVEELATPDAVRVLKNLFSADNPRNVV